MAAFEDIVRPFQRVDTGPQRYYQPGAVGVPPVRRQIGARGGTKTFAYSINVTTTLYMARINTLSVPNFDWPLANSG